MSATRNNKILVDGFIPDIITECKRHGKCVTQTTGSNRVEIDGEVVLVEKHASYSKQSALVASLKFQPQTWTPDRVVIFANHKSAFTYASMLAASRALRWCESEQRLQFFGSDRLLVVMAKSLMHRLTRFLK